MKRMTPAEIKALIADAERRTGLVMPAAARQALLNKSQGQLVSEYQQRALDQYLAQFRKAMRVWTWIALVLIAQALLFLIVLAYQIGLF